MPKFRRVWDSVVQGSLPFLAAYFLVQSYQEYGLWGVVAIAALAAVIWAAIEWWVRQSLKRLRRR